MGPLKIEREMWIRYSKFQPAECPDYRLPNRTRILLEYNEHGEFIERDPVSGAIIDVGVLEGIHQQKITVEAA